MDEPSEAAILKRAKELCEKDGAQWELKAQIHPGEKYVPLVRTIDKIGQKQYLARAKEQLREESVER